MELTQRAMRNPDSRFNSERAAWIGGLVMALGIGYAVGESQHNERFVQEMIAPVKAENHQLKTVVVPVLQAQVNCQRARGDVATAAATGAEVDPLSIPTCPPATSVANLAPLTR